MINNMNNICIPHFTNNTEGKVIHQIYLKTCCLKTVFAINITAGFVYAKHSNMVMVQTSPM